jgi:D-amino-acid dehydrogenase
LKRAVVVGAGVIGLACAYSLRKRDYEVTIVDAVGPGAGASEGNAGWITPSLSMPVPAPGMVGQSLRWMLRSDSPLYIKPTLDPRRIRWLFGLLRNCNETCYSHGLEATARLNERTFELFDDLQADGVEFEMHKAGLLFCFLDPGKRDHMLEELARVKSLGYSPLPMSGSEMQDLEPQLADQIEEGILVEQERQVRPESLVTGYVKRLLEEGVEVVVGSPIGGFERSGDSIVGVRNGEGSIEADEIVIAAGAHTGRLVRQLGVRLPIDAGKGYSLHYEPAPIQLDHALYLYEARVGVTSFDGAIRFAGTMEFSGINTRLRPRRVEAIARSADRYLSGWPADAKGRAWAGMRPIAPDGLPVIGRIAGNITVAAGHSMLGVTLAPVTGELVAASIAGADTPDVLRPFDPLRFTRNGARRLGF